MNATCITCSGPATVCHECIRALALKWFGAIARHPEAGTGCLICEQGRPTHCGDCAIAEVAEYRRVLRAAGNPIDGEPGLFASTTGASA